MFVTAVSAAFTVPIIKKPHSKIVCVRSTLVWMWMEKGLDCDHRRRHCCCCCCCRVSKVCAGRLWRNLKCLWNSFVFVCFNEKMRSENHVRRIYLPTDALTTIIIAIIFLTRNKKCGHLKLNAYQKCSDGWSSVHFQISCPNNCWRYVFAMR